MKGQNTWKEEEKYNSTASSFEEKHSKFCSRLLDLKLEVVDDPVFTPLPTTTSSIGFFESCSQFLFSSAVKYSNSHKFEFRTA
jgi:hypothetical protein